MHIGKSTRKIKEQPLGDFITQQQHPDYVPGQPKRQHFFGIEKDVKEAVSQANAVDLLNSSVFIGAPKADNLEKEIATRREYNSKVTELNPKYSSLQPNSMFILRCFIYTGDEGLQEGSNLIIGTTGLPKIPIKTRNSQAEWREVTDKFAYRGKAIIVSVPSTETDYKAGDIVQINEPRTACPLPESDFQIVENSYLHPDSKHLNPPTNPEDEDFGYVIVNRSQIILRLPQS